MYLRGYCFLLNEALVYVLRSVSIDSQTKMGSEEGKSDNSDEDYDGYKLSYYEGRNLNNLEQMEECLQRSMRAKFKVLKCFLVAILSSISLLMILFTVLLYFELSSNRNSGGK